MTPGSSHLHRRLTLWYVSVFGLILLLFICAATVLEYWQLNTRLYHAEIQDVETAEGLLAFAPDGRLALHEEYHNHPELILWLDRYMEVLTPQGQLLLRNTKLRGQPLGGPVFKDEGLTSYDPRKVRLADGTRLLMISHIHAIHGRPLLIRLAYSTLPIQRGVIRFLTLLLLAMLPTLLIAGAAGYRMAFKVLLPLKNMALRAETITANRLDQRLPVANPDDELGHMARVFNDLLQRLQNAFDNLKRFTADASHELRTPLASIQSVGEVGLQRPHTADEYRDIIGSMLEEVNRLTGMVDELLTIARAEGGQVTLNPTTFRALQLAQEVADLLEPLAEEKGQHLQVDGAEDLFVCADRMMLERGLANLVENAIKYSPLKTFISVHVNRSDGYVEIAVEDRGETIPEELRQRIFERFFRLDASRSREVGGSGLGLAIAKWAIEISQGVIEVRAGHRQGNTFAIRLPAVAEPSPADGLQNRRGGPIDELASDHQQP